MNISLKDELNIFSAKELSIEEGLTIVAGCNGAGKSTLLREIRDFAKSNKFVCMYLDCAETFTERDVQRLPQLFMVDTLNRNWRSEHEHYEDMFFSWVGSVRPPDDFKGKNMFVLIDGLDSGGDAVNFQLHVNLFDLMISDAASRGIHMYVIVTCNNFHYLCQAKKGTALYCPTFDKKPLPAYSEEKYMEYVKDVRHSAKVRGFVED